MNISGIRPYIDYNKTIGNIETNRIENQQSPVQEQVREDVNSLRSTQPSKELIRPDASETSYEYAQKFQPDAVHEMKGPDSSLGDMDLEQVISDKHKDQLMKQYQLFVNNGEKMTSKNMFAARPVENFVI